MTRKDFFNLAVLFVLASGLYFFNLGGYGLIDPDEPFYAGAAREMFLKRDWSTPLLFGQRLFEKPVFIYWVIAACYELFGVNEFSARLGPAVFGVLTVLATYFLGLLLFKRSQIALIGSLVLAFSLEFIILSRIVLTDMVLTFFFTGAFLCFFLGYSKPKYREAAWLALFFMISMGFLTKGPLAVLVPFGGILIYLLLNREEALLKKFPWKRGILIFLLIGFSWYALMILKHGEHFLKQMFIHENIRRFFITEHEEIDRFLYYPLTLFVGFFPWSIFVPFGIVYCCQKAFSKNNFLFLNVVFWTAFTFFSFAKSKLPSYIFPIFPVVALMIGAWIYKLHRAARLNFKFGTFFKVIVALFSFAAPLGLIIALYFYDHKMKYGQGFAWLTLGLFLTPVYCAALFFWFKQDLKKYLAAILLSVAILVLFCFGWIMPRMEYSFSSRQSAEQYRRLVGEKDKDRFHLASKMYVRGFYYYANIPPNEIGVFISNPDIAFYTRHPISIWSKREDLLTLKNEQFPVYCFFRPKEFRLLKERMGEGFQVEVIQSVGDRVFVKLDKVS